MIDLGNDRLDAFIGIVTDSDRLLQSLLRERPDRELDGFAGLLSLGFEFLREQVRKVAIGLCAGGYNLCCLLCHLNSWLRVVSDGSVRPARLHRERRLQPVAWPKPRALSATSGLGAACSPGLRLRTCRPCRSADSRAGYALQAFGRANPLCGPQQQAKSPRYSRTSCRPSNDLRPSTCWARQMKRVA